MDPLSLAASIAGVATAAFQIIGYLGTAAAGGKERLALLQELSNLWITITALQAQIAPDGKVLDKDHFPPQLLSLFDSDSTLNELETLVKEVEGKLKPRSARGSIRQTLAWPLAKSDVIQIIERISRIQQTLHFALEQSNYALSQEIYRDGQAVKTIIDEARMKEMIDWVSPLNFVAKQSILFKEQHDGTCKWFLESEKFLRWKESENALLFCPGIPGAGKTLLSSIVVNELDKLRLSEKGGVKGAAILMLYCKWDDSQSQSIDGLLASLIKQLAQRYGIVSDGTSKMFSKHSKAETSPSRDEYLAVLNKELANFPKAFIIVDGLDELREERGRLTLIETLTSLDISLNIMATSRPVENITRHFANDLNIYCDICGKTNQNFQYHCGDCDETIRIVGFDVCEECYDKGERCGNNGHIMTKRFNSSWIEIAAMEQDLLVYVKWRIGSSDFLQRCVEMKTGLMASIVERVVNENDGMFLLAKFNMDTLASKMRPGEVVDALKVLPKELSGTYTDAMTRIGDLPSSHKAFAMDFLGWVVFAERPLECREIEHAIAVSAGDHDVDPDNIIRVQVLASMCAGLVKFDESDCVRLVHYSAKNYFSEVENQEKWFPEGATKLASTCLTYLLFDPFQSGPCSGPSEPADFDERLAKYPLLKYASEYWGVHLLQSPQEALFDQARTLLTDPTRFASISQALWYVDEEDSASWTGKEGSTPLHLAAHFGLNRLAIELLQNGIDPNTRDINGVTPLAIAAARGATEVGATLIQAGADINSVDNVGGTPLHGAVTHCEKEMVRLLLQQEKIDVNLVATRETPLMIAAYGGYLDIIRLFLKCPSLDINKRSTRGTTALMRAALYNEKEAVDLLLTHPDIDIDLQDVGGSTALLLAAKDGDRRIVEALLDHGADTEVLQDGSQGTVLNRAIDYNQIPVVRLLLDRGANVHHKDVLGRGMLHSAAINGCSEIIQILLEFDNTLDVNMQDVDGKTTLHDAARAGSEATARVLLEYGADVTVKDSYGRTPVYVARETNNMEVLKLLREARRANKERERPCESEPGLPKRTETGTIIQFPVRTDTEISVNTPLPIWALASSESIEELKSRLLNSTKLEINAQDPDVGDSALHYSATRNNPDITRLLIDHGADLDIMNKYGRTPLHLTSLYNSIDVTPVLLDAGADMELKDQWGDSPLTTAMYYEERISTMLVAHGANLPKSRRELNVLLEQAVVFGNEAAVRRLVAAGAEILRKDTFGHTPFTLARVYNHEEIAKLLLELGNLSESSSPFEESEIPETELHSVTTPEENHMDSLQIGSVQKPVDTPTDLNLNEPPSPELSMSDYTGRKRSDSNNLQIQAQEPSALDIYAKHEPKVKSLPKGIFISHQILWAMMTIFILCISIAMAPLVR